MTIHLPTKKADGRCSCVNGHYECGFCRGIKRQRIWNKMSEKDRAYDRYVDPANSAALDSGKGVDIDAYERGCSCHLCAPCGFCTSQPDEEEATTPDHRDDGEPE